MVMSGYVKNCAAFIYISMIYLVDLALNTDKWGLF